MKSDGKLIGATLDGVILKGYTLHVGEVKQLRLSGWRGIKLFLRDAEGNQTEEPVIEGIYSKGNGGTIKPWMDLSYKESLCLRTSAGGYGDKVLLDEAGLDGELFVHLGKVIPAGGHLMVSYEGNDDVHRETMKALYAGVPPAATPLGFLIFNSGFHYVKDWYLAEGGHEGPRKLWGEKAPDGKWERIYTKKTEEALVKFLQREGESDRPNIFGPGRSRAEVILQKIEKYDKRERPDTI